jgi:type IV pilus assembly protein PilB
MRKYSLGEILLRGKLITQKELDEALAEQKKTKKMLGKILIEHGSVSPEDIGKALASQLNLSFIKISTLDIEEKLLKIFPEDMIKKLRVVPIELKGSELTVAMVDPLNIFAIQEMEHFIDYKISTVLTTEKEMEAFIEKHFGAPSTIVVEAMEEVVLERKDDKRTDLSVKELEAAVQEAPIVKLVNSIMTEAIQSHASDIHMEPQKSGLRIRYRVDGVLYNKMDIPKQLQPPVISRVKIIAGLDIADHRTPQDGRIGLAVGNRVFDIRVSTLPSLYGEITVLRILDKSSALIGLEQLGLEKSEFTKIDSLLSHPYGIILVTGPTGSGKTTTLYASLNKLNTTQVNIVTVEDPVEYEIGGICQVQVNPKAGITFSRGLRHILRQDPDIIMIGEIRDLETARIAIQASLTGHLVFSTLHTNDAPSAVVRLIDMDIESFLISSSVVGIIAQRLVRKLCPHCKQEYRPSRELINELKKTTPVKSEKITLAKPIGCEKCNQIGYLGRTAIFEIMLVSERMREMILARKHSTEIGNLAAEEGMQTLRASGIKKVLDHTTSLEEAMRVVSVQEDSYA